MSYREQKKLVSLLFHSTKSKTNPTTQYRCIHSLVWHQQGALLHRTPFLGQKPGLVQNTPALLSAQCHPLALPLYQSAAVLSVQYWTYYEYNPSQHIKGNISIAILSTVTFYYVPGIPYIFLRQQIACYAICVRGRSSTRYLPNNFAVFIDMR